MLDAGNNHRVRFNTFIWNINEIKENYSNPDVLSLFKDEDLVIICETHLGIRTKCPDGFTLVGRSKSSSPRNLEVA